MIERKGVMYMSAHCVSSRAAKDDFSVYDPIREALARRLCEASPAHGKAWADMLIAGHADGSAAMKSCEGKALSPAGSKAQPFFAYDPPCLKHRMDAEAFLSRLPGVLDTLRLDDDAVLAQRMIKANYKDIGQARMEILQHLTDSGSEILAALINYQRELNARMLITPAPYLHFSPGDHAAYDLSRAADYLIAFVETTCRLSGFDADKAQQTAYRLGHTAGAGREALRQAALAFDHRSFEDKEHSRTSAPYWIAAELAICVAAIAISACADAITDLEICSLLELLCLTSVGGSAFIVVFGVLAGLILLCSTPQDVKKANLIAQEAAERTRQLENGSKPPPVRQLAPGSKVSGSRRQNNPVSV